LIEVHVCFATEYLAFIEMNQLYTADTNGFLARIAFSDIAGGPTQPVITDDQLLAYFSSGLYNITLTDTVNYFNSNTHNELVWNSSMHNKPSWIEWMQEWQNLSQDAVIGVYDSRIVVLQGDEIRCFALKAKKDEDSSIVGRCVWACCLKQTAQIDETIGHIMIFNSSVYVPHKKVYSSSQI